MNGMERMCILGESSFSQKHPKDDTLGQRITAAAGFTIPPFKVNFFFFLCNLLEPLW
jgi:hypothetical protein